MSKELPHASIRCTECSTRLKITLKKGRLPSRPIPCPKCKTPIPVTESDVVYPGKKKKRTRSSVEMRSTRVSELHKTRDGKVTPAALAALSSFAESHDGAETDDAPTHEKAIGDPPTRDVPTAESAAVDDPPTRDVPTAESDAIDDPPTRDVPTADNEALSDDDPAREIPTARNPAVHGDPPTRHIPTAEMESAAQEPDREASETPGFGVIRKAKKSQRQRDQDSFNINSPGVHVVKGEGRAARDEVFSPRKRAPTPKGSIAIGRIRPMGLSDLASEVESDDPDLPKLRSPSEVREEEQDAEPKLSKPRLQKALARLKSRSQEPDEPDEDIDDEPDFGLDLESEVDEALERASSVAEIEGPDSEDLTGDVGTEPSDPDEEDLADVSAGDIAIEDLPMDEASLEDVSEAVEDGEPEADELSEPSEPSEPDSLEVDSDGELEVADEGLEESSWSVDGLEEVSSSPIDRQRQGGPPLVAIVVGVVFVILITVGGYFLVVTT